MPRRRRRPTRASEHRKLLNQHRPHYVGLLEYQGGCAICGRPPSPTRRLDLDHNHKTMEVRGLLCVRCNRNLPDWMTSAWLRRAADYLDDPPYPAYLRSIT